MAIAVKPSVRRPTLDEMGLSLGKRVRLHRLLFEHGPANGTLMLLPIDQGLEHGPRDFFPNPEAGDPNFQYRLAKEGRFSGIALHYGLANKYLKDYAGEVPLVLKLNGKTEIPPDDDAFSALTGSVEDAVRLGADAVGYTLYVGSPAQAEDFSQFKAVRDEADRFGMPVIVWAYPRGSAIEAKGGKDSFYAIDYAARVAQELGADIIKLNMPKVGGPKQAQQPKPYDTLVVSPLDALRQVVSSAGRSLVLLSGGNKEDDQDLLDKARMAMEAGCVGLIFGRNVWQRPHEDALRIAGRIHELMDEFGV